LIYMSDGVEMETSATGGMSAGFARYMAGGSVFLSSFRYTGEVGKGSVALGTDMPSKIMKMTVKDYEGGLMCQKGAFLAGSDTVNIEMGFSKSFTAGFFGGEGFVLQKLSGEGDAFVKATGALISKELKAGEKLRVTSGSIVAFEGSVEYDVQMMTGMKNVVFGGEGLFITTLTGPGRVYLQGMQFDRMVSEIARRIPSGGGIFMPIGGMGGGGGDGGAGGDAGAGDELGDAAGGGQLGGDAGSEADGGLRGEGGDGGGPAATAGDGDGGGGGGDFDGPDMSEPEFAEPDFASDAAGAASEAAEGAAGTAAAATGAVGGVIGGLWDAVIGN